MRLLTRAARRFAFLLPLLAVAAVPVAVVAAAPLLAQNGQGAGKNAKDAPQTAASSRGWDKDNFPDEMRLRRRGLR